jgi:two-component system phosphate regulon response regulator PhoB
MLDTQAEADRILVVEDDHDISTLIAATLKAAGFAVDLAADGMQGIEMARQTQYDLILLDWMMPKLTGSEVCKQLKADRSTARIPVIMVTARVEEIDRVLGFELGVDDYITKPFSPRELSLRVRAVLRRLKEDSSTFGVLNFSRVSLDPRKREVCVNGAPVSLTTMEFKLLAVLMQHAGKTLTRETLLKDVWNYQSDVDTRTVDTHIRRLREKLGDGADCIKTFRGFGYSFCDA